MSVREHGGIDECSTCSWCCWNWMFFSSQTSVSVNMCLVFGAASFNQTLGCIMYVKAVALWATAPFKMTLQLLTFSPEEKSHSEGNGAQQTCKLKIEICKLEVGQREENKRTRFRKEVGKSRLKNPTNDRWQIWSQEAPEKRWHHKLQIYTASCITLR